MDLTTAFVRSTADGTVDVVVNFGPLTGREATQAEVDRVARRLLTVASDVRVHAVRTHDMGPERETIVHQVVVEADASADQAHAVRDICEDWRSTAPRSARCRRCRSDPAPLGFDISIQAGGHQNPIRRAFRPSVVLPPCT